ncbi:MAG: amtB1 [Alphaproteobacteria bacterium]|jgi:Amt family ammonium transporter|nr:amtB1 [Alphaproteobacteria bacterium]
MIRHLFRVPALAGAIAVLCATPALAQGDHDINAANTAWMLVATALVLLMTIPGLALFYAGMVRKKNVLSTLAQSLATCALISVLWLAFGYSLTFGAGNDFIGDFSNTFFTGEPFGAHEAAPTIPATVFLMFQMTFAIITAAIIAGAVADRMKFSAFLIFMALWMIVVYCPVAHWVWGGGFLQKAGVLDFAGGIVVHINAGIAGLVAAIYLGPRRGYGSENMAPHNLTFSVIGVSLLWVGWFGFNAGSALAADHRAGMAMLVTHMAASAAALTWMLAEWKVMGKPSVLGIVSGAVAGLGTVTPAAGFVTPVSGLIIGAVAGVVCFWASTWLKRKLKYDDSLDVFGVHGVGGILGTIATGIFATTVITLSDVGGWVDGKPEQILKQLYGVGAVLAWSGGLTLVILKGIDLVMGVRVPEEVEIEGLDLNLHGEVIH